MGVEADLVAERYARGCRCFAVLIDDAVAGYGWLSVGPEWIGELQLEITPGPLEGYIWNCFTLSQHRRRGIFRSLLVGMSEAAKKEGFNRLWVGTVAIPAEKAVAPSGFKHALHFVKAGFAGLQVMRVAPSSDPALAQAACGVLSVGPGLHVRRSRKRRH